MRRILAVGIIISFLAVLISQKCLYWFPEVRKCYAGGSSVQDTSLEQSYASCCSAELDQWTEPDRESGQRQSSVPEQAWTGPKLFPDFNCCCYCKCVIIAFTPVLVGNSTPEPNFQASLLRSFSYFPSQLEISNPHTYSLPQGIHHAISTTVLIC